MKRRKRVRLSISMAMGLSERPGWWVGDVLARECLLGPCYGWCYAALRLSLCCISGE